MGSTSENTSGNLPEVMSASGIFSEALRQLVTTRRKHRRRAQCGVPPESRAHKEECKLFTRRPQDEQEESVVHGRVQARGSEAGDGSGVQDCGGGAESWDQREADWELEAEVRGGVGWRDARFAECQ